PVDADATRAVIDGRLWLSAGNDEQGAELWRTSPLGDTVALVHDIAEGRPSSVPQQFTAAGTNIFFTAYTPEYGRELWAIDRPAPPAPGMGQLAITMPANGVVIGPGLACGSTGGACTVVLPIDAVVVPGVTFTATVRSDVPAVFASECPSVGDRTGFSFILDPARLAGGVQNVQVRVTDSNGRIATTNGLPVRK